MTISPPNSLVSEPPDWLLSGSDHLWLPYTQMKTTPLPLPVVRTEGVRITLADGRELIDGVSSWWTACHGYNHPHILAAVSGQLRRMPHVMIGGLAHEPAMRLACRLAERLPGDLNHVFFSESGSVAVEIAMKIAVQYWINLGQPRRRRFVSFRGGYHGDTFATMSVCDPEEGMHTLFAGILPEQILADLPRDPAGAEAFDTLLALHRKEVAAIIVEPLVQGAGGMRFHKSETLQTLRDACDRHGVLMIVDEIMTGFGRTGTLFACEQARIVPDIITLGKGLTGGVTPLAATAARREIFEAFLSKEPERALMHGPTYTAHALACAAANASLDLFDSEARLAQVLTIEEGLQRLLEPCRSLPGVVDVRAKGAIGVVQVGSLIDNNWLKRRFIEKGVWLRPFRDIIYTTPPFVIGQEDLTRLTGAMVEVVSEWSERFWRMHDPSNPNS